MGFKLSTINATEKPEGGGFAPLEPGLYMAHIEAAEKKVAKTGTEMLSLTLQVKDLEGNTKGKLWTSVYFTAKGMYGVKCLLNACQIFDCADGESELEIEQIANLIEKHDILIHTKIRPAEGQYKEKAEIDTFGPMGGYAPLDEVNKWYTIIVEGKEYVDENQDTDWMEPEQPNW